MCIFLILPLFLFFLDKYRFEDALLIHTSTMDKYERWTAISKAVGDKTKNQCIMRYRYLKEYLIRTKEIEHISSIVISNI
jgi:hypothetical protein